MTATIIEKTSTLCELFATTAAAHADEPALRSADGTIAWTWGEYAERVRAAASAASPASASAAATPWPCG